MDNFITFPSNHLFIGKGSSGKTETIKHILKHYFSKGIIHYVIVFCSEGMKDKYYEFIPEEYVHTNFCEQILLKILALQTHFISINPKVQAVIIFDDIAKYIDKFSKRCKTMIQLFVENKNFNISTFTAIQSPDMITSETIRDNINFAWIYKLDSKSAYKAVYDLYGLDSDCNNWQSFKEWLDDKTGDYKILINIRDEKNPYKPFYNYKHKLVEPFKLMF